jgi:hypothetical protein
MTKPDFVTFTGADEGVAPADLCGFAQRWGGRVEFAFLYSEAKEGLRHRYPAANMIDTFVQAVTAGGGRTAIHICGSAARRINAEGKDANARRFAANRYQMNLAGSVVDVENVTAWAGGKRVVLQCGRDGFPTDNRVDWLFDVSGGRGKAPGFWPTPDEPDRRYGYAGGLGPGADWGEIARAANGSPYWVDMESGVRHLNTFRLALCQKVMEEVYG